MICFLTGRPDPPESDHLSLNPANGLVDELRRTLPRPCRALEICSDPDAWEKTDFYAAALRTSFERSGFSFSRYDTLDGRNEERAAELVRAAELLILAGGHVPTQNRFFQKIGLKELLRGFDGVLLGISAGSMNCAELVYAQPEEEGETSDPAYRRFLPGLGLTKTMLLPHWQEVRDEELDGLRLYEDIAVPDSMGREFLLLPDGSYLLIENGREELRGEAWLLADGELTELGSKGFKIIPYTAREIPAVLAFERRLREEEDVWGWEIDEAYVRSVEAGFRDGRFANALSYLALEEGQVIGRIDAVLIPSHFDGSVKAYLDWICVLKSRRHRGAAQCLLSALREELKQRGVDTLIALTAANDEAQRFYRAVPDSIMRDTGIWIDIK